MKFLYNIPISWDPYLLPTASGKIYLTYEPFFFEKLDFLIGRFFRISTWTSFTRGHVYTYFSPRWNRETYSCRFAVNPPDPCFVNAGVWIAKTGRLLFYLTDMVNNIKPSISLYDNPFADFEDNVIRNRQLNTYNK